jgi:predicted glutamine amidotransferase
MCGLVGVAGAKTHGTSKMFKMMLLLDVVRGLDSTGVAFVPLNSNKPDTTKAVGHPGNLWEYGSNHFGFNGMTKKDYRVLIGHNRAATLGALTEDNAHPFTYGDITGAHNGTLTDWWDLEGYKDLDVDSKALFNTINLKGIDYTWKNFRGAAAITYWDESTGLLHMIRNKERPLYFTKSKDQKTLFWASEPFILSVAAHKANIELVDVKDPIQLLAEDRLYTFEPEKDSCVLVESRPLEKKLYGVGYATRTATPCTKKTTIGHSKKESQEKINQEWAKGLGKAPKSMRGQRGKLVGTSAVITGFPKMRYAILEMEDGTRLEVYPATTAAFNAWAERAVAPADLYYEINFRPRVKMSYDGRVISALRVAESGVRLVESTYRSPRHVQPENTKPVAPKFNANDVINAKPAPSNKVIRLYKGPDGPCTAEDWAKAVSKLSPVCSCSNCTQPMGIEDHEGMHWANSQTAFCVECAGDQKLMTEIYYMKMS